MSIKADLTKAIGYGNSKIVAKGGTSEAADIRGVLDNISTIEVGEPDEDYWNTPKSVIYYTIENGNWKIEKIPFTRGDIITVRAGVDVVESGLGTVEYNPDMTFDYWSCPYEIVDGKIDTLDIYSNIPIGAIYTPTEQKNVFVIELNPVTGLEVEMFWINLLSPTTLTIDWGDGTVTSHTGQSAPHTYTNSGVYVIKAKADTEDGILFGYDERRTGSMPKNKLYAIFCNTNALREPYGYTPNTNSSYILNKAYMYDKVDIYNAFNRNSNLDMLTFKKLDYDARSREGLGFAANIETIIFPKGTLKISKGATATGKQIIIPYGVIDIPDILLKTTGELIIPDTIDKTNIDIGYASTSVLVIGKNIKQCKSINGINVLIRDAKSLSNRINSASCVKIQNLASIPSELFYVSNGTNSLKHIDIPDTITSIGSHAFRNCKLVVPPFVIPDSVKSIGVNAFYGFSGFGKELITPKLLTVIADGVFGDLPDVETIIIADGVTKIGSFSSCPKLTEIIIPDGVTKIGSFSGCPKLTEIIIPDGVTKIGGFSSCPKLTEIIIPDTVTEIGTFYFNSTTSVEFVIPDRVSIMKSVPHVYLRSSIIVKPVTPPTLSSNTLTLPMFVKIYVPDESLDAYKKATNWVTYKDYIYPISQKPIEK